MIVDESFFGPLRSMFGGTKQELPLLSPSVRDIGFDKWAQLRRSLPKKLFTPTHEIFADDLPEPTDYGDAGRGKLEIVLLLAFLRHIPVLAGGHRWLALDHQSGGILRHHPQFIARRLMPRASIYPALRKIARDRWPSGPGDRYSMGDASQAARLRSDLGKLGMDCEHTSYCLDESVYPIDATPAALGVVTDESLTLSGLIANFDQGFERRNLAIIILTTNSD
jgi:hypothetical protein